MRSDFMLGVSKRALLVAAAAGVIAACAGSSPARDAGATSGTAQFAATARVPSGAIKVSLAGPRPGTRPIAAGFVGISLEYFAIEPYAGKNPAALDPVFVKLLANLSPGGKAVLRIGGDSTDWAWWPVPQMRKPGGVKVILDQRLAAVTAALARQLSARLVLGIDLEANSEKVASVEATQLVNHIGSSQVAALELGNEPELYGSFGWYRNPATGKPVTGRPAGYNQPAFNGDFRRIGGALPKLPLAGPATGAPKWMATLPSFLRAAARLGMVTLHRYPLQQCYVQTSQPQYPTVAHIFAPVASRGLADSVAGYTRLAHTHRLPLRIDEMGTISCGSGAVGHSFASALWQLDALFEMARVGVDGVNIHSYPRAPYSLFDFKHRGGGWTAHVWPQYYGMLLFAQAAPAGSRLLSVSGHPPASLHVWATLAPDGTRRVVAINEDNHHARQLALPAATGAGPATLERLQAPSPDAQNGVTLGGRGFGSSTSSGDLDTSRSGTVSPVAGTYSVSVPAGSAVMVTLP